MQAWLPFYWEHAFFFYINFKDNHRSAYTVYPVGIECQLTAHSLLFLLSSRGAEVSDCGQYLIITTQQDCRDNLLYYAPLPEHVNSKIDLTCIIDTFEADYEVS